MLLTKKFLGIDSPGGQVVLPMAPDVALMFFDRTFPLYISQHQFLKPGCSSATTSASNSN
jgi:hypothetical protein